MTALAMFLICISFPLALLSFFPQWVPESPGWLSKVVTIMTTPWVSLGCFIVGFLMLFAIG